MTRRLTESVVEEAALDWIVALGYAVAHGSDIAPGEAAAERRDYAQVVLERRLREALVRLNPELPAEAIDDAFRRVIRPEGPTLEARNRAFHRMIVEEVTVEYRRRDGSIGGAQVRWRRTTGSRSTSSPSSRTSRAAAPTWSSSSTGSRWPWSS